MGAGVNSAGVIDFPTSLDQTKQHTFQGTIHLVSIPDTDLQPSNFRYGLQLGNFQLLTDIHMNTVDDRGFNYGEIRAKLKVLPLDDLRTDISVGLLGRYADSTAGETAIDDRISSLFVVVTSQVFLFGETPMLTNVYLDNLYFSLGVKLQAYQFVTAVAEADYVLSDAVAERSFGKIGVEIEGEQNFFFQIFYSSRFNDFMVQIGSGF